MGKDGSMKDDLDADPDMYIDFFEIVEESGFISEIHPVTTDDGYKLKLFRIRGQNTKRGAPAVFLQHGVLDTAACWIMHYAALAPAFRLVNEGYDVWLGNQRGSKYSIGHTTLSTESKEYWQFSFTEMGEYDAKAMVEHALMESGHTKLTFVGHSQGTSQMFYAAAAHPDYWY